MPLLLLGVADRAIDAHADFACEGTREAGHAAVQIRASDLIAMSYESVSPTIGEADIRLCVELTCRIADQTDLVPVRAGSFFDDGAAVARMLTTQQNHFRRRLDRVRGCLEFTIRLAAGLRIPPVDESDQTGDGAVYLLRRRTELAERDSIDPGFGRWASRVFEPLITTAREWTPAPPSPAINRPGATFLVPREVSASWRQTAESLVSSMSSSGQDAALTGPWPPYTFAS